MCDRNVMGREIASELEGGVRGVQKSGIAD